MSWCSGVVKKSERVASAQTVFFKQGYVVHFSINTARCPQPTSPARAASVWRSLVARRATMPLLLGETARGPASRHIFAIVCCVRSTKVQTMLNETSLYRTLYPSLRNTVTPRERKLWRVRLYLCADDNDQLFQKHAAQVAADSPPGLETRLLFIPARSNRVPSRESAEQARHGGRGAHAHNAHMRTCTWHAAQGTWQLGAARTRACTCRRASMEPSTSTAPTTTSATCPP